MLTLKDHGYTPQEKRECGAIFDYLSCCVCYYCQEFGQDIVCTHTCPYRHIIADLERVTKINKK